MRKCFTKLADYAQNIHKIREVICGFCCDSGSSNIFSVEGCIKTKILKNTRGNWRIRDSHAAQMPIPDSG